MNMYKKYPILIGSIVLVGGVFFGATTLKDWKQQNSSTPMSARLAVVSTFYPLAYVAERVGGDLLEASTIVPAGVEPHDYEPTPQDIIQSYRAKVFILNGGGVDTWAEKTKSNLESRSIVVVDMYAGIQLTGTQAEPGMVADPHIWLDPVLMQQEAELVRDALVKADPIHADAYTRNTAAFVAQLRELDADFKTGLASCELKEIITSHAAFGYMAKRYGFNQISIAGLSPDAEPSAQQLSEIATLAKRKKITHIFFETLVSPKLSQTIAREVGAYTIAFNPLEGLTDEEIASGKTYLREMRTNLENLKTALHCK